MFNLLLALILPLGISAQTESYIPMILNTATTPIQTTTYSIGYLPLTIINPLSNSSACRRVSMFKFPASASGIPSLLKIHFAPQMPAEICNIGISLFSFQDNSQIGQTVIGMFDTNTNNTVDVSKSRWSFVAGSLYYLQIQPYTLNINGTPCIIRVPYNTQQASAGATASLTFALVIQQGPLNQPCGASPWTSVTTLEGAYIPMQIWVSPNQTPTVTPIINGISVTASQRPMSNTDNVSLIYTPSPAASQSLTSTSSPSASQDISSSHTLSHASSSSSSHTLSHASSSSQAPSAQSETKTPSGSITVSYANTGNSNDLLGFAVSPQLSVLIIAGGILGSLLVVAAITSLIVYINNNYYIKHTRSPVTSHGVVVNNPVQLPPESGNTFYTHHV